MGIHSSSARRQYRYSGVNDNHARWSVRGPARDTGNAAAAHAGFRRVITEHHHQFAVFDI